MPKGRFERRVTGSLSAMLCALAVAGAAYGVHAARTDDNQAADPAAPLAPAMCPSNGTASVENPCSTMPSMKRSLIDAPNPTPEVLPSLPVTHTKAPVPDRGSATDIATVKREVIGDFYAADQAEVMPSALGTRVTTVQGKGFVSAEQRLLSKAWAPSMVASKTKALVAAMRVSASDPHAPSFAGSKWDVIAWQGVTVANGEATAMFVADEQERFTGGDGTVPPGWFDEGQEQWDVHLTLIGNEWLMTSRTAATIDQAGE